MQFDVVVLTDPRYLNPKDGNIYIDNVLLEDQLVLEALDAIGVKATRKTWDDPKFDWSTTKYALFRATWDYFDRFEEFSQWYQNTSKLTQFINSKELIDWNIDKHYLKELESKGINIPNTLIVETGEPLDLAQAIDKFNRSFSLDCEDFVLKPCISGGARHTYRFHKSEWEKHDNTFKELVAQEAMMLQEFQHNIVSDGEISLMLFNGQYTHSVLKVAKSGDFRVQDDFGGSVHNYTPSEEEIKFAQRVVEAAPELPTYARVDIFKDNDGNWALAELEIFEPELWFRNHPKAASILAHAIKEGITTESA
ncbi:ATP-grasp domain-containing protein [Flagellimonas nanhaiensis]|uniref:ATP-grasp fold RimK-type domain-containing protein n=1 Tax=Flagellimonas nanhaiensis TaxID=2292706 RepID=A0A371JUK3_9FLAO|nr:hypothetical protein [Allomuricauda nanhaiensis]RDY61469.1 hypothetical protein DX873_04715 [Allomuricauda nanhaiensis]